MAAMKTSPGLVNFFIYNSTFGPKEGMVCDMILGDYALLWLQNLAAFNIGVRNVPKWLGGRSHLISFKKQSQKDYFVLLVSTYTPC